MTKTRKTKAPAIDVPQSDEAADAILRAYGQQRRALERIETRLKEQTAALKEQAEADAKPIEDALKTMFGQLQAYAAAHRDRLTDKGKSKTVAMPAGQLGWRSRPPSVRWSKGVKAEDVLDGVRALAKRLFARNNPEDQKRGVAVQGFIRTKHEPNKEAMLASPELAMLIDGVEIGSAGEEFYVEPVGLELAGGKP